MGREIEQDGEVGSGRPVRGTTWVQTRLRERRTGEPEIDSAITPLRRATGALTTRHHTLGREDIKDT
eukprot:7230544-Pyramimonas_sp.AAC.1